MTCKRCVVIFLKTVKGVMFDINLTFSIYLVKSYSLNTMIFILVYAKSFKSIVMSAYKGSFCSAVDLNFVQMLL